MIFADHEIPQLFRGLGIFQYSDALANKIDNRVYVKSGSSEEIEIRAATLVAAHKIMEILREKGFKVYNAKIDYYLWKQLLRNLLLKMKAKWENFIVADHFFIKQIMNLSCFTC